MRDQESSWRYAINGDVLTATSRILVYTIQLNVPYPPLPHTQKTVAPRSVTQFLDGGARLYTSGAGNESSGRPKTLVKLVSFVGTYAVPRVARARQAATASVPTTASALEERLQRLESTQLEMFELLRRLTTNLGVA